MKVYRQHLFICTTCSPQSAELIARLQERVKAEGLGDEVRVNAAGCLRQCDRPIQAVAYPAGVWYGRLSLADADELFERQLVEGKPLERLVLQDLGAEGAAVGADPVTSAAKP